MPSKNAASVESVLQSVLYNLIELHSQIKSAHWNLVSPNFIALHEHFDKAAEVVYAATDEVAERVRQLGSFVDGSTKGVLERHTIKAFPSGKVSGEVACKSLAAAFKSVGDQLGVGIELGEAANDPVTTDLLTQVYGRFELQRWLIESHIA